MMRKYFLFAAVAFAAVAGYTCYSNSSESNDEMSEMARTNMEALASDAEGIPPTFCSHCVSCQDEFCQCHASIYHGYVSRIIL